VCFQAAGRDGPFPGTLLIQGLHASSVVFADFGALSGDLLANLRRTLPGIDSAGYPVSLHGDEYKLRLGQVHREKRDLVAHLHLESKSVPFQAQLTGTVRLQDAPKQSRTKVVFEGRCARNFGSLTSTASTETVRLLANDSSRALLDLLVTAMERTSNLPAAAPAVAPSTRRAAGVGANRKKPGT
jgi:hypothetical protein